MHDLTSRRLYLCVGHRDDIADFLPAVLRGGVDVVQLREKDLDDDQRRVSGRVMAAICRDFGVPFIMNDSPYLAAEVGADGVHVGQEDLSVAVCRELLGPDAIVGLSTHDPDEFERALAQPTTYRSAGPIVATPTKPGRTGTGIQYALDCTLRSDQPVFVTGAVDADNVASLVRAGLGHFVVVRALTNAPDPFHAAASIRRALDEAIDAAN
ncbi:MAG: thiamine phosphate synthase [Actinomycetales bacterium]|nr:thiamine phosphate synthase [Actinomycetales bacterium]